MKVAIFGSESDYADAVKALNSAYLGCSDYNERDRHLEPLHLKDYDELRQGLAADSYDLVMVLANGAEGMEACIGTRKIQPRIPLFWFSDDPYFGPQSYRLGCTYFSTKPPTEMRMRTAIEMFLESTGIGPPVRYLTETAY